MSAAYRVHQFIQAVGAWFWPEEVEEALLSGYLSPQGVDLFRTMPRYDRQRGCTTSERRCPEGVVCAFGIGWPWC
ncbi:MAG: hypothetical protein P8189_10495 [Anaerolineae bacterium]